MENDRRGRPLTLVAERDRTVRDLQLVFLKQAGFAVEFVEDGQCALDRMRLAPPV